MPYEGLDDPSRICPTTGHVCFGFSCGGPREELVTYEINAKQYEQGKVKKCGRRVVAKTVQQLILKNLLKYADD